MKKLSSLLFCTAIYIFSFAQAPQKFNYQGIARGQAGNILTNKNLGFKISILQGSPTGTVAYSESHSIVSDNSGVFSLQVGTGTVLSGTFSSIDWGGNTHYLKTEMDTAGGTNYQFIGTTQLLSVPYALHSASSGNAGFSNFQVFDTAGIFTVPSGVTKIMVEVWGGGGGGSGAYNQSAPGGGGGGYGKDIFSVTPAATYTVTVGAGGSGGPIGTSTWTPGVTGGSSSLGSLISASGGIGAGIVTNYLGGDGGTSLAAINITGGSGGFGSLNDSYHGNGGNAGNGGFGGLAGFQYANGHGGTAPGGGGGGAGPSAASGGNGATGRVVVWW